MRLRNIPGAREKIESSRYVVLDPTKCRGRWKEEILHVKTLHVEIGSGKGRFLLEMAKKNPSIGYVGIEKFSSVLLRAIEKLDEEEEEIPNLLFIRFDAEAIETIFAPGEADRIYLNFSDPWPKDRHHKRRLTSREFLSRYRSILCPDGTVEFKTDNEKLFDFSLKEIEESGWELLEMTRDLHRSPMNEGNVMTEYEEKFSILGNRICKLITRPGEQPETEVAAKDETENKGSETMKLAKRNEVPKELTWDLSLIYPTDEAMEKDTKKLKALADHVEKTYMGHLNTAKAIVDCLDEMEEIYILRDHIGSYTGLAVEVDYTDTKAQEKALEKEALFSEIFARLSFVKSEICDADEDVLKEAVELAKGCKNYLKDILRDKPHRLSPETEKALASFSRLFETPYNVYNMAKLADMKFDSFTVNGREYPLGYSLFEDDYEYENDTDVRRTAFRNFSDKIKQYENVTAAAYNSLVTAEKTESKLRGYDSVFDFLLHNQKVTREMYDRQIDLITKLLAPAMRKYARVIQATHHLDKMTFADLKLPVDSDYDPRVTVAESLEYVKNGLSILGPDYVAMVEEAYRDRWIDFAKNEGKCTGGFCSSPYRKNSFILLSWNDRMADVFTIAHELGHAGHSRMSDRAQSAYDTDLSTYFVEAPSTMNELLLGHYLLKTNDDKRFRRWVLSSMIGNTYYHNFVTHLREAWYQREVYKIIDDGGSVNAETLSSIFKKNLELFWGPDVEITEGAELTWMRQPHYYMGLYSYTYSAGLTVATEVADRIEKEGEEAVEDWKKVLSAGGTMDPAGLAMMAKIDISTDKPLRHTIETISGMIDEIASLTEEIDGIRID